MDLELAVPYQWARGVQTRRHIVLVRLEDGDCTGWGEIAPPPDDPRPATDWAKEARMVVDPDQAQPRIRCGMQQAQLDVEAQRAACSVSDLLWNAPTSDVPVNTLITANDPDVVRQLATSAALVGYPAIKIKIGMDPAADLARAKAAREGAPNVALRLDANAAWSPQHAEHLLSEYAPLDIDYIEQPVAPQHEDTLRDLQRVGIPIALDESATSLERVEELLDGGVGDVVIVKAQRLGGCDRAKEVLDAARRRGARAVVTNSLESSVGIHHALHLAAGTTEPAGLATSHYLADDVGDPPAFVDGRFMVPHGPGLGIVPRGI